MCSIYPHTSRKSKMTFIMKKQTQRAYSGFPGGSDSKESAYNVGDLGSVLGWADTLEKGMATHLSMLAWRIQRTEEAVGYNPQGRKESDVTL